MNNIDNTQEVIDSRDIIERVEELEQTIDIEDVDIAEAEELEILKDVIDQAYSCEDCWTAETLIREDYFTEYCEIQVIDFGDIPESCPSYIKDNIDWKGVASDLKQDYVEIDFNGTAYFMGA